MVAAILLNRNKPDARLPRIAGPATLEAPLRVAGAKQGRVRLPCGLLLLLNWGSQGEPFRVGPTKEESGEHLYNTRLILGGALDRDDPSVRDESSCIAACSGPGATGEQ